MSGHGGKRIGAGRKKGVPNKPNRAARATAREYALEAIDKLVEIMRGDIEQPNRNLELAAAKELLDRGLGRAPQPVTGEDGEGPLKIEHVKRIIEEPDERPHASHTNGEDLSATT